MYVSLVGMGCVNQDSRLVRDYVICHNSRSFEWSLMASAVLLVTEHEVYRGARRLSEYVERVRV
jgi:hypothetical protein